MVPKEVLVHTVNQTLIELLKLNIRFENETKLEIESVVPVNPSVKWKGWKISYDALLNTLNYCVKKLAIKCQLLVIDEGKLQAIIHIHPRKTPKEYIPFLKDLNKKLKWPRSFNYKGQNLVVDQNITKRKDLRFMNCLVSVYPKENEYEPSFFSSMFEEAAEKHPLPNGVYMLSTSDVLVLRNDGKEPWVNVVGGEKKLFSMDFDEHIPILGLNTAVHYRDIPIPTYDDWIFVTLHDMKLDKLTLKWSDKIEKAVFRGSATGCGFTIENNPRFKAAWLSKKYPQLLNAGITRAMPKIKIHEKDRVGYNILSDLGLDFANFIPFEEQSQFKYLLHLDGNVAAYRLGKSLLMGSVILIQESGSRVWFQGMMKPYEHYVPVDNNLSNLISQIKWCIEHDEECEKIAQNGMELGRTVMTKDAQLNYLAKTLWDL